MKKALLITIALFFFLSNTTIKSYFAPPGIDTPQPIAPYLNGVFPTKMPGGSNGNWAVEIAYPNLTFTDPLAMLDIPDQSGFYIVGKPGFIWKISDDPNVDEKELVLDISNMVDTDGDAGLINAILHPEFGQANSTNKDYLYLIYRYHPDGNISACEGSAFLRLSRFTKKQNSPLFDPDSELVLVQHFDPHCWHMGGGMFFDDQGFLNFFFGDAGGASDEFETTQQIDKTFFGGLLRIDVDKKPERSHPIRRQLTDPPNKPTELPSSFTQDYFIPNDNPWQDENGSILEEFYALGFRSPHRGTFDSVKKQIWVGDVGQGAREEISVVEKGGNYQWPYKEGKKKGPKAKPDPLIGEEYSPIFDYKRSQGNAIIGGFVYRGSKFARSLSGQYIFGDHGTLNIWALNPENGEIIFLANIPPSGIRDKNGISSFATDSEGEIYILKLFGTNQDGGVIYKLKPEVPIVDPPKLLSQIGAFSNLENLKPADGFIPYAVNTPFWSDGASKKRWIAVPNDGDHNMPEEQIKFSRTGEWRFPSGTVFMKHFDLPLDENNPSLTQRVETRFIIIAEDHSAYGLTYKWNDAGTDAELLISEDQKNFSITRSDGTQETQTWSFPSRTACNTCHNANAGFILGVKTRQLNGELTYSSGVTDNQLNTWHHLNLFVHPFNLEALTSFPKMVSLQDQDASLESKVRSYLDANCAQCHRPNGVEGLFDARFSTPLELQNLVNTVGISRNTPSHMSIVKPGEPALSELWLRDNKLGENAMPPLNKNKIDQEYIGVLTEWINSLNDSECTTTYLSDIDWVGTAINARGPVELDQSNGEQFQNDGNPISINGLNFSKGLGVHAYSEITYSLNGQYQRFKAFIGVDDESCSAGSVRFHVYTDNTLVYQSPLMVQGNNALPISINIKEKNLLKLVVTPDDFDACDHADWADARLERFPDTHCNCFGSTSDSDGDGICDEFDLCPGFDDGQDNNGNGLPDGCETISSTKPISKQSSFEVTITPNPFSTNLRLFVEKKITNISNITIRIVDINGRIIFQKFDAPFDTNVEIPIHNGWTPGIYLVNIQSENERKTLKVIKQ